MTIESGLVNGQVLQRDGHGHGAVRFSGNAISTGASNLEFRIVRRSQIVSGFDWTPIPTLSSGRWGHLIERIPAGGPYRFELRLTDANGLELDRRAIHDVLVGDLWLLAGQSNMDGCGPLEGAEAPSEMVHGFSLANDWQVAEEPLHRCEEAAYPVYLTSYVSPTQRAPIAWQPRGPWPEWNQRQTHGAGLGIPFGKRILEQTGIPIGLILCSLGGTTLQQWSPELRDQGGRSLYGAMLDRVQKAGGRIRGVLWYQGESDSYPEEVSRLYEERFTRLIRAMRTDFSDPALPVLTVQIGRQIISDPSASPAGKNLVREAQRRCMVEISGTGLVTAVDLGMSSSAHIDTDGYKRVGRRLANLALSRVYGHTSIRPGPRLESLNWDDPGGERIRIQFAEVNGRLRPATRVLGFSVRTRDGRESVDYLDARVADAGDAVVIHVGQPVPKDAFLWYGYGWNPACNLVDSLDMAVPAMGPIEMAKETTLPAPAR